MFELIIIWETGEKESHLYETYEKAEEIAKGMRIAFGRQIAFTCINERR